MNMKERELRDKRARKKNKLNALNEKLIDGKITTAERIEFDKLTREMNDLSRQIEFGQLNGPADVAVMSREAVNKARGLQTRVAHDTSDLPSPDKPIESRHDIRAWYAQRNDYARYEGMPAVTKDWDSFDKESFYRALLTGNRDNREYRAMAEGSQSFSVTGGTGGYITPIQFSMDILPLLRAALLFTSPTDDGSLNGPMVYDMDSATETVPTWSSDGGVTMTQWLQENTQMTPTQPALGLGLLTAKTMACVVHRVS
jgi:hypothetical protein